MAATFGQFPANFRFSGALVFRLVNTSEEGVISGYFAPPKKAKGKLRSVVSLKYPNAFITYRKFCIVMTTEVARWIR